MSEISVPGKTIFDNSTYTARNDNSEGVWIYRSPTKERLGTYPSSDPESLSKPPKTRGLWRGLSAANNNFVVVTRRKSISDRNITTSLRCSTIFFRKQSAGVRKLEHEFRMRVLGFISSPLSVLPVLLRKSTFPQKLLVCRIFSATPRTSPRVTVRSLVRNMSGDKKPFERLPASVIPTNYELTLQPNLTEFSFTGKEVIQVEVSLLA